MSIQTKRVERLAHQLLHEYLQKIANAKSPPRVRTQGWCEFCGKAKDIWDIVIVKHSDKAMEMARQFKEQMACRDCISKHGLTESESEGAVEFEATNLAIKWLLGK